VESAEQLSIAKNIYAEVIGRDPTLAEAAENLTAEQTAAERLAAEYLRLDTVHMESVVYDEVNPKVRHPSEPQIISEDQELKTRKNIVWLEMDKQNCLAKETKWKVISATMSSVSLTDIEKLALLDSYRLDEEGSPSERFLASLDALLRINETLQPGLIVANSTRGGLDHFFRIGDQGGLKVDYDSDTNLVEIGICAANGIDIKDDIGDKYTVHPIESISNAVLFIFNAYEFNNQAQIPILLVEKLTKQVKVGDISLNELATASCNDAQQFVRAIASEHMGLDDASLEGLNPDIKQYLDDRLWKAIFERITNQATEPVLNQGVQAFYIQEGDTFRAKYLSHEDAGILADIAALLHISKEEVKNNMTKRLDALNDGVMAGELPTNEYLYYQVGKLRLETFVAKMYKHKSK
jgi:hypothetical protein